MVRVRVRVRIRVLLTCCSCAHSPYIHSRNMQTLCRKRVNRPMPTCVQSLVKIATVELWAVEREQTNIATNRQMQLTNRLDENIFQHVKEAGIAPPSVDPLLLSVYRRTMPLPILCTMRLRVTQYTQHTDRQTDSRSVRLDGRTPAARRDRTGNRSTRLIYRLRSRSTCDCHTTRRRRRQRDDHKNICVTGDT